MQYITAYIDKNALVHNIKQIKKLVPQSNVIAVVKANAYGHGAYAVTNALKEHVQGFAVARISEAIELRKEGITTPIFLLEGFYNDEDVAFISRYNLYTSVHDIEQVEAIEKAKVNKQIHVWLQIDVGMHRLGSCDKETIFEIKKRLEACKNVVKPIGLISHLSVADTPSENDYNQKQIQFFKEIAKEFEGDLCLTNSAGIFKWPESHTQWVRPGIVIYGISPFDDKVGSDLNLIPAMTLECSILALHKVKKGDKIGYGAYFVADKDTTIGVISCGYGDGYPRCAPNGTPVLVNGRIVPTAGHVCMDMMFVDLGPNAKDRIGDKAVLWGKGLPVETIAKKCNTIPYELICHIMPRVNIEFG
ncbi:MAG: alanine racemase [Aeromonadales bacterium]|nr:alanine racemase [Aeromonadales bacterium]